MRFWREKKIKLTKEKGLTVLEVMIGMIILAFGILGLAPLIGIAIYGNSFSDDITRANSLARKEMELLISQESYGVMPLRTESDSVYGLFNVSRVVEDNSITATVPPGLFRIKVAITWTDQQNTERNVLYSTLKPML